MEPLLKVKNLSVSLGGQEILENISFDVSEGDNLAIIGPNGAGKTILLRAILGLIPFSGEVIWRPGVKTAYVPQKIDFDRYLPLSLADFLRAKARLAGISSGELGKKIKIVGFDNNFLKKSLGSLSFGQFQKALIVFALLGDPDIIFLDEATLGVDAPYESYIYEVVRNMQAEKKLAVVLVSHEFEIVYKYADKVLCLNRRMLCFGPPDKALNEENLANLYYGGAHYKHHH